MTVAVLSDIHANLPALDAVLADIPDSVETFLFCGDIIGYYCWPNAVIERARDHAFRGVRGNHDEAIVRGSGFGFSGVAGTALRWNRDQLTDDAQTYVRELPYSRRDTVRERDIYVVHGSPSSPVEEYVYPEQVREGFLRRQGMDGPPDILLMGHTHVPFATRINGTLVANPGSVGQPRDGDPKAAYALLDLDALEIEHRRTTYDIDRVADRITSEGLPDALARRLYDGR